MKYSIAAVVGIGLLVASALADEREAPKGGSDLKDVKSKASYGIGVSLGRTWKQQSIDVDPDLIARGIRDALAGKPQLTDQEIQAALQTFQQELVAKKTKADEEKSKAGEEFLVENKAKPGVKTTQTGLQYKVIKEGTGATPKATDTVTVNYKGTLVDGTEFDSSYKRGKPVEFPVNRVIPGWTEALKLMKVGSKWQLFIPANLAYGPNPPPGSGIPANAPLVFEVELLEAKTGGPQ
jgi:FKBP-type peptidyl-prolyl cis-trans isomerase